MFIVIFLILILGIGTFFALKYYKSYFSRFAMYERFDRKREEYYELQDWENLAHSCEMILKQDPNARKALNDLSIAYLRLGKLDEAMLICNRIEEIYSTDPKAEKPSDPRYMGYRQVIAEICLTKGNEARAIGILEDLKKLGRHFSGALLLLIDIYMKRDAYKNVIKEFEDLLLIYNKNIYYPMMSRLNTLLKQIPAENTEYIIRFYDLLVSVYEKAGELDARIKENEEILKNRFDIDAGYMLLAAFFRKRDFAKTLYVVDTLRSAKKDTVILRKFYIEVLIFEKRYQDAYKWIKSIPFETAYFNDKMRVIFSELKNNPGFIEDYAAFLLTKGELDLAMEGYGVLMKDDPDRNKYSSAVSVLEQLDAQRTIVECRSFLEKKAKDLDAGVAVDSGTVKYIFRPSERFKKCQESYIPVDDNNIKYWLAEAYKKTGDIKNSLLMFQQVGKSASSYRSRALYEAGMLLMGTKQVTTGKEYLNSIDFSHARFSEEEKKELMYSIAEIYEKNDIVSDSLAMYEKIAAIDTGYRDVSEKLVELKRKSDMEKTVLQFESPEKDLKKRYTNWKEIGRGGMGAVYEAYDTILMRKVALKVMAAQYQGNTEAVQRFIREAQTMAKLLQHPGMITIYDIGSGTLPYISMELIEGKNLRNILDTEGALPLNKVLDIGIQVCEALEYAHGNGIIHRDIKPDNILVTVSGDIRLTDFGLAHIDIGTRLTCEGRVMGTQVYMSPEQIRGEAVDYRTDIYSLGVTLYELSCGKPPFEKGDISYKHLHEEPEPPSKRNSSVPPEVESIILKCLSKNKDDRPPSCNEMARYLREFRDKTAF